MREGFMCHRVVIDIARLVAIENWFDVNNYAVRSRDLDVSAGLVQHRFLVLADLVHFVDGGITNCPDGTKSAFLLLFARQDSHRLELDRNSEIDANLFYSI